jgi:hypothetical protein
MSFSAILTFLISNGPNLIRAGMDIGTAVGDLIRIIRGKPDGADMTADEFNAFVDKHLKSASDKIEAHVAAALKELEGSGG